VSSFPFDPNEPLPKTFFNPSGSRWNRAQRWVYERLVDGWPRERIIDVMVAEGMKEVRIDAVYGLVVEAIARLKHRRETYAPTLFLLPIGKGRDDLGLLMPERDRSQKLIFWAFQIAVLLASTTITAAACFPIAILFASRRPPLALTGYGMVLTGMGSLSRRVDIRTFTAGIPIGFMAHVSVWLILTSA